MPLSVFASRGPTQYQKYKSYRSQVAGDVSRILAALGVSVATVSDAVREAHAFRSFDSGFRFERADEEGEAVVLYITMFHEQLEKYIAAGLESELPQELPPADDDEIPGAAVGPLDNALRASA
ncbi:MAG: hypothetical protein Q7R81_04610 [Candidatus Peregrinibacteria bacterium]|nr:hypothetical protein [Candidatus Peregrinibacteria bacterium]